MLATILLTAGAMTAAVSLVIETRTPSVRRARCHGGIRLRVVDPQHSSRVR